LFSSPRPCWHRWKKRRMAHETNIHGCLVRSMSYVPDRPTCYDKKLSFITPHAIGACMDRTGLSRYDAIAKIIEVAYEGIRWESSPTGMAIALGDEIIGVAIDRYDEDRLAVTTYYGTTMAEANVEYKKQTATDRSLGQKPSRRKAWNRSRRQGKYCRHPVRPRT